jgi:hypothetical protein
MNNISYSWPIGDQKEQQRQEEAFRSALVKAAKKSESKVLKDLAKEEEGKNDKEKQMKCRLACKVFDESMEMYREGEMTYKEAIDDLYNALKAIA